MRNELQITDGDLCLISVGEINANKNHRVIIEAMSILQNPHLQYFIVGKGNEMKHLKQFADSKRISDNIHFLGFREDILNLLKAADIFCFPSKREGLGLAAIEAMAAGLPLITSNIHGIKDYSINGETGYTARPENAEDFSKIIYKLAGENLGRYKNKNSVLSARYSVKNVEKYMRAIYQDIVKQL